MGGKSDAGSDKNRCLESPTLARLASATRTTQLPCIGCLGLVAWLKAVAALLVVVVLLVVAIILKFLFVSLFYSVEIS